MRNIPIIFILVAILSIVVAIQSYQINDEYVPKEHNHKSMYQKHRKLTPQEEKEMLADILDKITSTDGDISEPMAELELLVRESPSTPKNLNFTAMVRQLEQSIRENVTKMVEAELRRKEFPKMEQGIRYKRSNDTYQACVNILTTLGSIGGGSAGAAIGASLFSIIPVIGTIIGGILGAQLGASIGKSVAANIATSRCPK